MGALDVAQPSSSNEFFVFHLRGYQPMAYQETAPQDSQGSAQSGLHWGMASCSRGLLCSPSWSEGLPSPHRNQ